MEETKGNTGQQKRAESDILRSMRSSRALRWYVLSVPASHKGINSRLEAELQRRRREGEKEFEYFAPTYTEVTRRDGAWVKTTRALLYNYVFVRASENEIYRMMRSGVGVLSFLPRVKDPGGDHYPYLSDKVMDNLKWVARSYSENLPVTRLKAEYLLKGDRVRITQGQFKGVEAIVCASPGAGKKTVAVQVEDFLCVPLIHVREDQYEVVSIGAGSSRKYSFLNNMALFESLHEAMGRVCRGDGAALQDRKLALDALKQYRNITVESDVLRCKQYSILLQAYVIAGNAEERDALIEVVTGVIPYLKAERSLALLVLTLYGCTDSSIWHARAHELIDRWRGETSKKKIAALVRWLDDFDRWFGH